MTTDIDDKLMTINYTYPDINDDYLQYNEIYMIDIYNEIGLNYSGSVEKKMNISDSLIKIYFPIYILLIFFLNFHILLILFLCKKFCTKILNLSLKAIFFKISSKISRLIKLIHSKI